VAQAPTRFVAECFWVGVKDADLIALDRRVEGSIAGMSEDQRVRYLGSILMREDEVVLCFFEGSATAVRHAAEQAQVPFERILESGGSAWQGVRQALPKRKGR
jgi:hypothetical protein